MLHSSGRASVSAASVEQLIFFSLLTLQAIGVHDYVSTLTTTIGQIFEVCVKNIGQLQKKNDQMMVFRYYLGCS